ncbi:hypothetical protein M4951_01185 [Blastopirellula sp. J2-11]|uniref:hypothetical protein n=1 Tax=Blastopirellula sp. J2-11 TaxID=2943192 RepID=UPI0021C74ECB|nr:hypothetical protein [Blastopirellula sp. J2-11]UUO06939.1 hypothetical protein M4951_01185 [Blastopirellula sp. J2-11]
MSNALAIPDFILVSIHCYASALAAVENPYCKEVKRCEYARRGWLSYRPRMWVSKEDQLDLGQFVKALKLNERNKLVEVHRDRRNRPVWVRLTRKGKEKALTIAEREGIELEDVALPDTTMPEPPLDQSEEIASLKATVAEYEERLILLEAAVFAQQADAVPASYDDEENDYGEDDEATASASFDYDEEADA